VIHTAELVVDSDGPYIYRYTASAKSDAWAPGSQRDEGGCWVPTDARFRLTLVGASTWDIRNAGRGVYVHVLFIGVCGVAR
jgi:hypothetical protein